MLRSGSPAPCQAHACGPCLDVNQSRQLTSSLCVFWRANVGRGSRRYKGVVCCDDRTFRQGLARHGRPGSICQSTVTLHALCIDAQKQHTGLLMRARSNAMVLCEEHAL